MAGAITTERRRGLVTGLAGRARPSGIGAAVSPTGAWQTEGGGYTASRRHEGGGAGSGELASCAHHTLLQCHTWQDPPGDLVNEVAYNGLHFWIMQGDARKHPPRHHIDEGGGGGGECGR